MSNADDKIIVYKIRNMLTGEFSQGGAPSTWTKKGGKIWKQRGHLINHLKGVVKSSKKPLPWWWEVVEYNLIEGDKFAAAVFTSKSVSTFKR